MLFCRTGGDDVPVVFMSLVGFFSGSISSFFVSGRLVVGWILEQRGSEENDRIVR